MKPPSATELRALQAAASWYARLCSGHASSEDRLLWQRWRDAHDSHAAAWQRIESLQQQLGSLPGALAAPALQASAGAAQARRAMLRNTLAALGVGTLAWQLWDQPASRQWRLAMQADLRTATGERRRLALPDGSQLALDTASSVDLAYDTAQRLLLLRGGEILVETRPDPYLAHGYAARPFLVDTLHARIRALGTRFTVRSSLDGSTVTVLDKAVEVRGAKGRPVLVKAGQQLQLDRHGRPGPLLPAPFGAGSWQDGSLLADNLPLGQLLAELARYRHGLLQCDPRVAAMPVSGSFPLDDTDRALQVLANALPLRIVMHTRFWVRVSPA